MIDETSEVPPWYSRARLDVGDDELARFLRGLEAYLVAHLQGAKQGFVGIEHHGHGRHVQAFDGAVLQGDFARFQVKSAHLAFGEFCNRCCGGWGCGRSMVAVVCGGLRQGGQPHGTGGASQQLRHGQFEGFHGGVLGVGW